MFHTEPSPSVVLRAQAPSPWFARLPARAADGVAHARVVAFPYAGGGASVYWPLARALPPTVDFVAVQYPGREGRLREPALTCSQPLIEAVADALTKLDSLPTVFVGYSMGAVVALEVARALRARGAALPVHLLVAARPSPHVAPEMPGARAFLDGSAAEADAWVLGKLKAFGGVPSSLLDNPEFMAMILPTVRADFRMMLTHRHVPGAKLPIPITAFGGSRDSETSPATLCAWAELTSSSYVERWFDEGHFFLKTRQAEFASAIVAAVAQFGVAPSRARMPAARIVHTG